MGKSGKTGFDQTLFLGNYNVNKLTLKTESDKNYFYTFLEQFKIENTSLKIPDIYEKLDAKKTLFIFDYPDNHVMEIFIHILNKSRIPFHCMGAPGDLDISQSVFSFKHIQRLIMSESDMTPSFVFIEKKASYTMKDIESVKNNLQLNDADLIIIKANNESSGRGNVVLKIEDLLPYLNSPSFKNKYCQDLVILIEQVSNEKVSEAYHTHRFAAGFLPDDNSVCIDVFREKHLEIDSHIKPEITWLNQPVNNHKNQIDELLNTIQKIDYFDLIQKLLSSNNKIKILLGIDFLSSNTKFLFNYSPHTKQEQEGCKDDWSFSLNISESILIGFKTMMINQEDKIKRKLAKLVSEILDSYKQNKGCSWLTDETSQDLILQLNDILSMAPAKQNKYDKSKDEWEMFYSSFFMHNKESCLQQYFNATNSKEVGTGDTNIAAAAFNQS